MNSISLLHLRDELNSMSLLHLQSCHYIISRIELLQLIILDETDRSRWTQRQWLGWTQFNVSITSWWWSQFNVSITSWWWSQFNVSITSWWWLQFNVSITSLILLDWPQLNVYLFIVSVVSQFIPSHLILLIEEVHSAMLYNERIRRGNNRCNHL